MEQLSLLQKIYLYGETLSSEELNQIVLYLNSSIEAINALIARNNNINEGHCEMRYKVSAQLPEAPESGTDGKSNGWSDTYTKPDTANGEITWMTLSFFNGEGVYGAWSTPVCITWGSVQGQLGKQGNPGIKGPFKSRVFKRLNSRPDTPTGGTYDNPIPSEGGWTDGIPTGKAIIWSSVCTFYGNGLSSGWTVPAPESDNDTLDIEFSPNAVQPEPPTGDTPFSNHESEGWYDPSSNNFNIVGTMIWRAERKVSNGEYNGDWTITRIVGEKGDKGDSGLTGGHYEFRYNNFKPSEQASAPTKPSNGSNGTTGDWTTSQETLTETLIKDGYATWMTQCYQNESSTYGIWTDPIRITGANGEDGEDGIDIEFVYTRREDVWTNPTPPPTTQTDDWPTNGNNHSATVNGVTWYDNPLGVTEVLMYEYVSLRLKVDDVWSAYSTPVVWSKWGEKGMDGDGYEYIYKRFATPITWADANTDSSGSTLGKNDNPANWAIVNNKEYYGPTIDDVNYAWSDDPVGIDETYRYEYVSCRRRIDELWGAYETPKLWSGVPGVFLSRVFTRTNDDISNVTPSGGTYTNPIPNNSVVGNKTYTWTDGIPDGKAIIWSSTCMFNWDGTNGGWSKPLKESDTANLDIEFTDANSTNGSSAPEAPSGNTPFSDHSSENPAWYDPSSIPANKTMVWRAERKVANGVYVGNWVITRIKGEKGDPGTNGGNYEFRYTNFKPTNQASAPTKPTAGTSGTTSPWSATQSSLTEALIKEGYRTWMSYCFKTAAGTYGTWSDPVRITGANGLDGEDGSDVEFIYTRNNTGSTPSAPTASGTGNSRTFSGDDWYGLDNNGVTWTDNPVGVESTMKYEYVAVREKPAGKNQSWGAYHVALWSKWGEKGMDGDGFEYIYKKFQTVQNWANITGDNNPANWKTNHPTEFLNTREYLGPTNETKWNDDPLGIDENYKYEYVSVRLEIDGVWNDYSTPTLWSGIPGGHYEFRYIKSKDIPNTPTAGLDAPSPWSAAQQSISESEFKKGYKVWMTYCFKTVENTYGTWSDPIRISGANGLDGEDGSDIEFLYARTKTSTAPTKPSKPSSGDGSYTYDGVTRTWNDEDWGVGKSTSVAATDGDTTWSDNPRGVLNEIKYEWVIVRTKPAGKNTSFEDFSSPTIWSKWGEKGMDGDGMLYVFKLFSSELTDAQRTSNIPTKPTTMTNNEWIPSGWSDDPISPTSNDPFCYCSVIKKINGTWGSFEKLSLWAKYSKDGSNSTVPGPDGKGITYVITRDTFSESNWSTYCAIDHSESFSRSSSDLGSSCRAGDFFIVKGTATDGQHKFHLATFKCTAFDTSNITGTCISHIKDGDKGLSITGKTGPMFYIAGIWNSTTQYTKNDYKCPVVFYDDGTNERYYYLIASSSRNLNPSSNSSIWGLADNFEAIFTKVLFSNFAKLGSFVINQDWMISQHGVEYDSSGNLTIVSGDNTTNYQNFKTSSPAENLSGETNFCPNLAIDAKTGRVYAQRMDVGGSSTFKGTVYAENGTFNGNINAQQFTAGDPTGINITIEDDSIYFNYGGEHRAWFTTKDGLGNNGAGMYLYIKNPDNNATSNKVITIDFANLKFKDASGGSQAGLPQENYYSAGTNGMANQHTTIYLGPTDGLYYSNTGCTQLLNNTVYYKKLQHSYFILMQKSAEAKYYKLNIDLYLKITFTNGVASTGTTPLYKITKQGQTAYVYGSSSAVSASNTNVYSNATCTDLYVGTSGNVNWASGDVYLGKTSSTSGTTYISLCTLLSSNKSVSIYGPRERATIA